MRKIVFIFCLGCICSISTIAQWLPQTSGTKAHFRAVCAVSSKVCWIGGTQGTFLRTIDGGQNWQLGHVTGAEKLDFRDVQAFDAQNAILMSAGEAEKGAARVFKTADGGQTWELVYQTEQKGVFLDGMDFWDTKHGIVFGDPIEGKFFVLTTADGGKTWQQVNPDNFPPVREGEAAFAASGTTLVISGRTQAWIGTGGSTIGRVFRSNDRGKTWQVSETPMVAGAASGIFGLRFWDTAHGMAVGGDYKEVTKDMANVAVTADGGKTWQLATSTTPPGLKEAVAFLPKQKVLVAVGPSGTCFSNDFGKSWKALDKSEFHALSCAGGECWAVGATGNIAKLVSSFFSK